MKQSKNNILIKYAYIYSHSEATAMDIIRLRICLFSYTQTKYDMKSINWSVI